MDILIRNESQSDWDEVENLTREAFWNVNAEGCSEHYLAHLLRQTEDFIPELDYVALVDGKIVGSIFYAKSKIVGDDGNVYPVLTFGPISVHPNFQKMGIGKALIEHSKVKAKELGFKGIIIFGDPEYYCRTGFEKAENFKIGTSCGAYADPCLACELVDGGLQNCSGLFYEGEVYDIDEEKAEEFDRNFPPKEKISGLESQRRFSFMITQNRPRQL